MTGNYLVKKQARDYLKGNWGAFVAAFFVLFIPLAVAECIETCVVFFGIYDINLSQLTDLGNGFPLNAVVIAAIMVLEIVAFALFLPLLSGITRLASSVADGKDACCADIFYFFKKNKYLSALHFNLSLAVRKLLWIFISFIPAMVCVVASAAIDKTDSGSEVLSVIIGLLGILFSALGILMSVCITSKYFLAGYLYGRSDGEEKPSVLIRKSIVLMRGNTKKYLSLVMSFLPWILLSFFILPAMYVMPYMEVAFANSAKWIIKMSEQQPQYEQPVSVPQNGGYDVANNAYGGV